MLFADRRILITGASRGIGFATARRFLDQGARVVVNGRSHATVTAALGKLGAGDNAFGIVADLGDVSDCHRLVEETLDRLGGLDILVTAAGVSHAVTVEETTEELWDATFDVNVKGLFFVARAALTALREARGCIVNVASDSGVRGEAYLGAYCASKAAVINLTRAMALELAPDVRVNAVSPGYVDTDMVRRDFIDAAQDPPAFEAMLKNCAPLRRLASPEEIAAAICYLAGPDATFITGTSLSIDGGTTAGSVVEFG